MGCLGINATLTHIFIHPCKLEIYTSFRGQGPLILREPPADVCRGERRSAWKAPPALSAALLTGGKIWMMERRMKRGKADL